MSQSGWFYISNGQRTGPVDVAQLQQMTASGQVRPGDLVWTEGMADWQPANAIPGLVAAAPPQQAYYPQPGGYPQDQGYAQQGYAQQGYAPQAQYPNYGRPQSAYAKGPSSQGLAIAGLICAVLCSLLGLILSLVALNNMKKNNNDEGRGLAIAGVVVAIASMILGGLMMASRNSRF